MMGPLLQVEAGDMNGIFDKLEEMLDKCKMI